MHLHPVLQITCLLYRRDSKCLILIMRNKETTRITCCVLLHFFESARDGTPPTRITCCVLFHFFECASSPVHSPHSITLHAEWITPTLYHTCTLYYILLIYLFVYTKCNNPTLYIIYYLCIYTKCNNPTLSGPNCNMLALYIIIIYEKIGAPLPRIHDLPWICGILDKSKMYEKPLYLYASV